MSEALYYSDFLKETDPEQQRLQAQAGLRGLAAVVRSADREISSTVAQSPELKLFTLQQFMEQELKKAGLLDATFETFDQIDDVTSRFFPAIIPQQGRRFFAVGAQWHEAVQYPHRKNIIRRVNAHNAYLPVGRTLDGHIIPEPDFTLDQVMLVASQIYQLEMMRDRGELSGLDASCTEIHSRIT